MRHIVLVTPPLVLICLLNVETLAQGRVRVPKITEDKPPAIRIQNTAAGADKLDKQVVQTGRGGNVQTVNVRRGTLVSIKSSAINTAGGVEKLKLKVLETPNGIGHYDVEVRGTLDGNRTGPIELNTDTEDKQIQFTSSEVIIVRVSATNFNGQSASLTAIYRPLDRVTATLRAEPSDILEGASTVLSWDATNATEVRQIRDVTVSSASAALVQRTGSRTVNPSVTTTYAFTASNFFSRAEGLATVTVHPPSWKGDLHITYLISSQGDRRQREYLLAGDYMEVQPSTITFGQRSFFQRFFETGGTLSLHYYISDLQVGTWTIYALGLDDNTFNECRVTVPARLIIDTRDGLRCINY